MRQFRRRVALAGTVLAITLIVPVAAHAIFGTMPVIDWTSPGVMITMAAAGAILIVLGMLFYFLPA